MTSSFSWEYLLTRIHKTMYNLLLVASSMFREKGAFLIELIRSSCTVWAKPNLILMEAEVLSIESWFNASMSLADALLSLIIPGASLNGRDLSARWPSTIASKFTNLSDTWIFGLGGWTGTADFLNNGWIPYGAFSSTTPSDFCLTVVHLFTPVTSWVLCSHFFFFFFFFKKSGFLLFL